MSKKNNKGRLAPFVPMQKTTIESRAWVALSYGARCLFIVLKAKTDNAHYSAYLSTREAASKVGASRQKIREWFAELEHYGLIVMLKPGCLGSDGHGKAPLWRITDKGTTRGGYEEPTNDFLKWDGTPFDPKPYRRGITWSEKQNPGLHVQSRVVSTCLPPVVNTCSPLNGQGGQHVQSICEGGSGHDVQSITSLTTEGAPCGSSPSRPNLGSQTSVASKDPRLAARDRLKARRSHNGERG